MDLYVLKASGYLILGGKIIVFTPWYGKLGALFQRYRKSSIRLKPDLLPLWDYGNYFSLTELYTLWLSLFCISQSPFYPFFSKHSYSSLFFRFTNQCQACVYLPNITCRVIYFIFVPFCKYLQLAIQNWDILWSRKTMYLRKMWRFESSFWEGERKI